MYTIEAIIDYYCCEWEFWLLLQETSASFLSKKISVIVEFDPPDCF